MKSFFRSTIFLAPLCILLVSFQNCGPSFRVSENLTTSSLETSSLSTPLPPPTTTPPLAGNPEEELRLTMDIQRIKTGTGREIEVSISRTDRPWTDTDQLTLTANQGAVVTKLTNTDPASLAERYRIAPASGFNGELIIRSSFQNKNNVMEQQEKTLLVLEEIHSSFGQPEIVRGLVNTLGHEDGASISPDGEWLMIHYLPISFDCYIKGGGSPNSPDCLQVIGPTDAPERPAMPGRDRITTQNQVIHSCPRLGLTNPGFSVAPSSYYIFKKNSAGEFLAPREFAFLNGDGCFFPFGPQLQMSANGSARLYISWQNYYAGHNDGNDVHGMPVNLNSLFYMGILPATGQILAPQQLSLQRMGIPAVEEQGNPHIHEDSSGNPEIVFWDNETLPENDRRLKFVNFQNGSWSTAKELPASIFNATAGGAIQPFFDGQRLIFRAGSQIKMSAYLGGAMELASSWSSAQTLLRAQQSTQTDRVFTLGEPSITFDRYGRQVLYFVYATTRSNGKSDFNVAFVRKDP